jgi:hypothetical protein
LGRAAARGAPGAAGFATGLPATAGPSLRLTSPGTAADRAVAAPAPVGALLAVQGAVGPLAALPRDAAAEARAAALLHGLDALQCGLLGQGGTAAALAQLAATLDEDTLPAADPALHDALTGIELRVQIELARRTVPGFASP